MSCVRKRRGKWVIDFYDQFGRRHWETVGTNKKDAEEKLAERILEVGREIFQPKKLSKPFKEVSAEWYQNQVETKKRPKTAKYYKDIREIHLDPYFGEIKVGRIDFALIEKYMACKLKEGGLNKDSINKTVTTLGTILKYAVRRKFIESNPVPNVERFRKGADEVVEKKRFLFPKEIQILLKNEDPKWGPIILTTVLTGMRESEVLALQWEDVDFNQGQINVRRTLQGGKFYNPKTKTSYRRIDIDPQLITELKKWKLRCPKGEHDLVFPDSEGRPLDGLYMLKRIYYPALSRAKVTKIRFHDLRHTNASLRIEAGQNPKYIQEQLGHSSIQVTMDIYGHLLRSSDQDAAIKLREVILSPKNDGQFDDGSKMVAEG